MTYDPNAADLASINNLALLMAGLAKQVAAKADAAAVQAMAMTPGPSGPAGATGATGATGPAGSNGTNGSVGAVGPVGAKGDSGSQGPIGPQGPTGAAGGTGPAGPKGDTGPAGATGAQGAAGLAGVAGPKGDVGSAGPKGDTGATGAAGPQGPVGATGAAGGGVTLLPNAVISETALIAIGLGTRAITSPVSGLLVGDRIVITPAATPPAGYVLGQAYCASAGVLSVGVYGPAIAVGQTNTFTLKVAALR